MLERARHFRRRYTHEESWVWFCLRNRKLFGYKFVREVPIGDFIVDFLCRREKFIVEVDGSHHELDEGVRDYDRRRTQWLEGEGFRVLRVRNCEVIGNLRAVMQKILLGLRGEL